MRPIDRVLVTLGSMTEGSSLGSMDAPPPVVNSKADGGAWALWEAIASGRPEFGNPEVFANHVDQSKWVSFTTTLSDPTLLRIMRDRTGNVPGEGGLITFPQSTWLASIVVPYQPHFIGQPEDVSVLWGYGLFVDKLGDFVKKPMSACTGREIMTEVLGHLGVRDEVADILEHAICIPCMMPFITSQFLPRERGDRPEVIPEGSEISRSSGSSASSPRMSCSRSNTRSALRRRRSTDCRPRPQAAAGLSRQVRSARLVSCLSGAARQSCVRPRKPRCRLSEPAFASWNIRAPPVRRPRR